MTVTRHPRRVVAAAGLAALIAMLGVSLGLAPAAHATDPLPFNDRNVNGALTFCDRDNRPVTSGSITDIPFVWKAVSTTAAPEGWVGPFGKAHIIAVQPRENVDPGLWSGKMMTASAHYTNADHPMAQATNVDPALIDFTSIAPLWQGLLQIRMYYTNVDTQPHLAPYPATVIKVTGTHWEVVSGGSAPCTAGTAVSSASTLLAPSAVPSASPTYRPVVAGSTPSATRIGGSSNSTSGPSTGASGAGGASPTPLTSGGSAAAASRGPAVPGSGSGDGTGSNAASTTMTSGSLSPWILALLIALPVVSATVGLLIGRRHTDPGSDS